MKLVVTRFRLERRIAAGMTMTSQTVRLAARRHTTLTVHGVVLDSAQGASAMARYVSVTLPVLGITAVTVVELKVPMLRVRSAISCYATSVWLEGRGACVLTD